MWDVCDWQPASNTIWENIFWKKSVYLFNTVRLYRQIYTMVHWSCIGGPFNLISRQYITFYLISLYVIKFNWVTHRSNKGSKKPLILLKIAEGERPVNCVQTWSFGWIVIVVFCSWTMREQSFSLQSDFKVIANVFLATSAAKTRSQEGGILNTCPSNDTANPSTTRNAWSAR